METAELYATIKTELNLDSIVGDHVSLVHIASLFNVPHDEVNDIAHKQLRDLNPEELMVVAKSDFYKSTPSDCSHD